MQTFVAELIGTMILVLLGDGVVANVLLARSKGQNSGWIVITVGWGVAVDKTKAAAWFRQAAARGLTWAKYNYATLLALGDGVAEDKAGALALFEEAAAEGNAKAHNFVGSFHEDGWVVARDLDEAARHYAIAAAGGDFRGQFNHGRMLAARGETEEALHWMALAWDNGNARFRAQMIDYLLEQGEPFRSAVPLPQPAS